MLILLEVKLQRKRLRCEEDEIIISSDALNSIEKLIKYVQQNDLNINNLEMQNLVNLKKKIVSDGKKKQRQGRIDNFFNLSYF